MRFLTRLFLLVALLRAGALWAQPNITQAEYFFDTDPGFGNGIPINITSPSPNVVLNFTPNITGLSEGFHNLYVRGKDANGFWSIVHARTFLKLAAPTSPTISSFNPTSGLVGSSVVITGTNFSPLLANNTVRFNGVQATVTNASATSLTVTVPPGATTGLITVTVGGLNGNSGSIFTVILPNITALEYFFNTDPGPGNGTPISITPGTTIDLTNINISTTGLPIGWHTLCIRTRDANNVLGFYECRRIYIREDVVIDPIVPPADITQLEFFYNTDNGPGTGTAIPVTTGQNIDVVNANLANALPLGWHSVHVRAKNADNVWGSYESRRIFVRGAPEPCCAPPSPITEFEWFVDSDPGAGLSTTKLTINPSQTNIDLVDQPLDVGTQPLGAHKIYVRARNAAGAWSMSEVANFTVVDACPILAVPSATGVARCDAGPVTLTASGAQAGETYRWYATDTSVTPLFTGNPYTTASLNTNTTFYVTAYNPTTFCESARAPVTASISGIPKPLLNISGSLSVCEGTTQLLTAPPGFVSYAWSNGQTSQQITVATTGSYSVVVNNGVCSSAPSDAFVYTVSTRPAKPTLTGSNGGSLCGVGFVTLDAPVGFAGYAWSNGANTTSIDVTSVGSFAVVVTNAAGCQSVVSDPFIVTSGALAKPSVTVTGNTALCNGSNITLTAPTGFGIYQWSTGANTESIVVSTAGNYTVRVGNASCVSPASDAVVVTQLLVPAQPDVVVTGSTSLCAGAFAGLAAPNGFATYLWSNGETSRQIVAASAGNYSVQVGPASHCLSVPSPSITLVSTGQPCSTGTGAQSPLPPLAVDGSRCGTGAVALAASGAPTGSEYRWFAESSGGTSLSSLATFTTPTLSQATSYYVSVYDPATLLESARVRVQATIVTYPKPDLAPAGSLAICAGSSVQLAAPTGFTRYRWSRDGVLLTANTQQLSVSTAGTYQVEVGDGTCFGTPSDAVAISIDSPPTKPVVTGASTICGTGNITLSAPPGLNYLWSTNETTQTVNVGAGSYSVSVSNGSCSALSDPFIVSAVSVPPQPTIAAVGREFICSGSVVALSAPDGFLAYRWSTGATTQTILVDQPGNFSVQTGNAASCLSTSSELQEVRLGSSGQCGIIPSPTNRAPEIETASFGVQIQSEAAHPLRELIADEDGNLDLTSLRIIDGPAFNGKTSGGTASIDAEQNLLLDYRGVNFAGKELITVQVCDTDGLCAQQQLTIDVVGEVLVFNGITPDGDGVNDFMLIRFIDIIDGARKNSVAILNRWGDILIEIEDYNNNDRVFAGLDSSGNELPPGTYMYRVQLASGKTYTGYITIKR